MSVPSSAAAFGERALTPFADSIWTAATPIRFAGTWFPHVMTVLRLAGDNIVLHSPCRPSSHLTNQIAQLGSVSDVVAPNWFHDLYLDEYRALYPGATFWAPAFMRRMRGSLIDRVLDGAIRPPWFAELPHVSLPGLLTFDESIFFHEASRTLIVADLLMNLSADAQTPAFTRLGYRFLGLNGDLKVFPVLRWFGFTSTSSLRNAARRIAEWNPERLIVAHGAPIAENAASRLHAAFAWLKP